MQRGRLLIILGVILGLLTLGAVVFLLIGGAGLALLGTGGEPVETETTVEVEPTGIPTTQVIVALQPIARGSEFVAGSIGRRDWPANNVPPDTIADEAETIGKVAKTEVVQGQVIVRTMLVDKGVSGEAALNIPPGRVAVAYPMNRQTSVAYAIQPGDSVDILITAFFIDVDEEFQAPLPNKIRFFFPVFDTETGTQTGIELSEEFEEGRFELNADEIASIVSASRPQIPRRVAQLTVQSAKVLRVGPWIEEPAPPPPDDDWASGSKIANSEKELVWPQILLFVVSTEVVISFQEPYCEVNNMVESSVKHKSSVLFSPSSYLYLVPSQHSTVQVQVSAPIGQENLTVLQDINYLLNYKFTNYLVDF